MLDRYTQTRPMPKITTGTDTRDILAHATRQAAEFEDFFLVDIDAHVTETQFWPEIIAMVDNDVIRHMAQSQMERPGWGATALLNVVPGTTFQSVYNRIPHQTALLEKVDAGADEPHHFVQLARRSMDALGLDYQVVFPTPMLTLGMHPLDEIEVAIGRAYNKWMIEKILPHDARLKGLLYLPFNTPEACVKIV